MNEEENIAPLLEAVRNALQDFNYEVVLVDDGSSDNTRKKIIEHADQHVVLVELRKNYGQSTAMTAGIDHARGEFIAMIDGDLQNDPTDIPFMLELLKKRGLGCGSRQPKEPAGWNDAQKNPKQNSQCIN